jgi:nitrogen fixation/metabolism regulation signal transduction histidine kinase
MTAKNISSSIARSPYKLRLRLMRLFTVLFIFCVIAMSFFLYSLVRMVSLNNQSRATFDETRQIYQLNSIFKRYELRLKQYAANSSYLGQEELDALGKRADNLIESLQLERPEQDQAALKKLADHKAELTDLTGQLIEAVDTEDEKDDPEEQDWSTVEGVNQDVDSLMSQIYATLTEISSRGVDQLDSTQNESAMMALLTLISALAAVALFIILALIVAMLIYRQIILPTNQLALVTQKLRDGEFDPKDVENLARRDDEIGELAAEFIRMAGGITQRKNKLQQEADEIRAKIRTE